MYNEWCRDIKKRLIDTAEDKDKGKGKVDIGGAQGPKNANCCK